MNLILAILFLHTLHFTFFNTFNRKQYFARDIMEKYTVDVKYILRLFA